MFDKFSHMRKNMWLTVIVVALIGDMLTTSFGMFTPGVVESNPLWQSYFENGNIFGLFFGQFLIIGFGFAVDYILVDILGNWAFPLIPAYFVYVGTVATANNFLVLHSAGANVAAIGIVLAAIVIGIVEFVHSRYNYPLF